ncbi:FUSC family membrane protein [Flavobacterium sp.]|uniref:FUSC family membrane protein n=1 Tax=Flavobacterium sp. TaxID=239 RepID=UPI002C101A97|nr:FUSC family membrane protein [Flavobacterium sp.]HSD08208.1 FUSC family membrane protein [Flavobacterium sp.]
MIDRIRKFSDTPSFTNAIKATLSTVIPVLLFAFLGKFEIGYTIALGALCTYYSDVPSRLNDKFKGVLATIFIIATTNLLFNIIYPYPWIFYPFLTLLIFFLSMLTVYGKRGIMTSFATLLAISLAFAHLKAGWEMLEQSALLFVGGLFYLAISLAFTYINPYRYVELQIAECIRLTAKYLKLRANLWNLDADRQAIIEKQLLLQVQVNEIHQNIREVLIGNYSGSTRENRRLLIAFLSLLEIQELSLSTSFDHDKLHKKFKDHPQVLLTYQNQAYDLSSSLRELAKRVKNQKRKKTKDILAIDLNLFEQVINEYSNTLGHIEASEGVFMLKTMFDYAEKQIEKIKIIQKAFSFNVTPAQMRGKDKDLDKFLTPQKYPLRTLIENLSFSSIFFRHAVRLTTTILLGLIIGHLLPFHNGYWIMLTIVVIMRPGYGLTKSRLSQRIFGTVLGGTIAFGILYFEHNIYILGLLTIICRLMGFSFSPINYKVAATFVTMYVVFLYGILTPNLENVFQYRIIDTIVGGILAFSATHFLWPSWEFFKTPIYIRNAIKANRRYLKEISMFYNQKGEVTMAYRLARKNAFIEVGNLMSSFQRMVQEPKSKQKNIQQIYRLTELNHTLLSSIASLGTYIQSHKTTSASKSFNVVIDAAIQNLENAIKVLNEEEISTTEHTSQNDLAVRFRELRNIRVAELKEGVSIDDKAFQVKMQEAQLVIEQLMWLINLSKNIFNTTKILADS